MPPPEVPGGTVTLQLLEHYLSVLALSCVYTSRAGSAVELLDDLTLHRCF